MTTTSPTPLTLGEAQAIEGSIIGGVQCERRPAKAFTKGWTGNEGLRATSDLHQKVSYLPDIQRLLPQSPEAEKAVVCAALSFPGEVLALCRRSGLTAADFINPAHAEIYARCERAEVHGCPLDFITLTTQLRDSGKLEMVGGAASVTELFTFMPTAANVETHIEIVREKAALRQMIATGSNMVERCYAGQDEAPALLAEMVERMGGITVARSGTLESELDALRFDPSAEPPPEQIIYRLGDATIATAGNIVGLAGPVKSGKSAILGAFIASTMDPNGDTLGVTSANTKGGALIVFDSEQSDRHFHDCIQRALVRAGRTSPPWLRAYRLKSRTVAERRRFLAAEMKRAAKECGSIHSVILDGIGDMVVSPNDDQEAFGLIEELGALADKYRTVLLCVLHENPGENATGKTRGHLGSQLERKAETNLRLAKDGDGITVVFSERSRGAHIPKDKGPRFQWCDERKMHVSCETKQGARITAKETERQALVREVFADMPPRSGLKWKEIIERIQDVGKLSFEGARKRLASLESAKAVKHSGGMYYAQ